MRTTRTLTSLIGALFFVMAVAKSAAAQPAPPKVVLISLDGANAAIVEKLLDSGVLDKRTGLGRLQSRGIVADQNIPATPSVTAVSHVAIATGSTAVHNNIAGNTIHPVAATIGTSLSGFGAPIGGYQLSPLGTSPAPTAEPMWVHLRNVGRTVVTATWPGGDGVDVRISGTLVQPAVPTRTVDYTVPFGAFGGLGAQGFALTAAQFITADMGLSNQLVAAGHPSFSPVMVTAGFVETVYCAPAVVAFNPCGTDNLFGRTTRYDIKAAALDTTGDGLTNYDTLVFFDSAVGVEPGPFPLPATGPAYAKLGGPSARFFFAGSGNVVGASYVVTRLDPGLATVRFARYSANYIPRNAPVIASVNDVNQHVGFWVAQPDFRIPERLSPGFTSFPDAELEAMYEDQVRTFMAYQTQLAQRAIRQNAGADLVMIYFEQPDGSGHQFTLTDPRQASDPQNPSSIGKPGHPIPGATGQDVAKVARYQHYLNTAYQIANEAVEAIIQTVGVSKNGEPLSDIFVVSDHGMAPFHTAVRLLGILEAAGINTGLLGIRSTGPAVNIYVNLAGREPGGTVTPAAYDALVASVASALRNATDPNPIFNPHGADLFTHVWTRPACGQTGFCTDENIGQDSGDILALMAEGYNFDGAQSPAIKRLGDSATTIFSVPNFYGAHGHDSTVPSMSAILYAAGPSLKQGKKHLVVSDIDIAPTIFDLLNVSRPSTIDGTAIPKILKKDKD